jgi:arginine-tRNA-protein transferase
MESLCRYIASPSPCGYLPEQVWSLEYEHMASIEPAEYMQRMLEGWRRFGRALFRPRCPICTACRPLRVAVEQFRPSRSQRRVCKMNEGVVELRIGKPSVTHAKLDLYDRYHAYQADHKGWPSHPAKDAAEYVGSFVDNPFPTQEWCYYVQKRLVGVGYVDNLPGGLSAMYFYYDPNERQHSLGTWNVLRIIQEAADRKLPHVYLGYYIAGSRSMAYKAGFTPNQLLGLDGQWHDFQS